MDIETELKSDKFENEQMKATLNILFTASWLKNIITGHLKQFKLSHEQFNALRILRGQYPNSICQKNILSRMIDRNSNLTGIISKLTQKELIVVEQSKVDKREYLISISPSGMQLLQSIDLYLKSIYLKYNNLSASEAFHLNHLLNKMRDGG